MESHWFFYSIILSFCLFVFLFCFLWYSQPSSKRCDWNSIRTYSISRSLFICFVFLTLGSFNFMSHANLLKSVHSIRNWITSNKCSYNFNDFSVGLPRLHSVGQEIYWSASDRTGWRAKGEEETRMILHKRCDKTHINKKKSPNTCLYIKL